MLSPNWLHFLSQAQPTQSKISSWAFTSCDLYLSGLIGARRRMKIGSRGISGWAEHESFPLMYLAPDVIKDQCSILFPVLNRGRVASWEQLALCPCEKAK